MDSLPFMTLLIYSQFTLLLFLSCFYLIVLKYITIVYHQIGEGNK